jgi:hypothetical protein
MGTDRGDERWLTLRYVTKKIRQEQATNRVLPGTCRRRQVILAARHDEDPLAESIEITR